jgi:hypothetical protein
MNHLLNIPRDAVEGYPFHFEDRIFTEDFNLLADLSQAENFWTPDISFDFLQLKAAIDSGGSIRLLDRVHF